VSLVHCVSFVQAPQTSGVVTPQMRSAFAPVQSLLLAWQLPTWQLPW